MTSGCFTWIADFDQSVGVKRINTEWTHLQVKSLIKMLSSFELFTDALRYLFNPFLFLQHSCCFDGSF